jgi:phosphatidylserine/phosphatidylglycerophosphate/cardiolipin synthase-like enzyme
MDLPECATQSEKLGISNLTAPPTSREIVRKMLTVWQEKRPDVSPSHLAWALMAAGAADEASRDGESVELVWTGPAATFTSFRRTDQALLELIESAERSLTIVTFAAYKIPSIAEAIIKAGKRNVEVVLVVESQETSAGHYAHRELASWGNKIRSFAKILTWPMERRQRDSQGNHGSLHAKCAVADARTAFVSSANLTEYALNINMEMGVLIKGGITPRLLQSHFQDLIRDKILVEL